MSRRLTAAATLTAAFLLTACTVPEDTSNGTGQTNVEGEAAAPAAPAAPERELTQGQENALDQASNYLDFQSFSRPGLIKQLEFEGYSTEDATFAVDDLAIDWMEQAAKKAKEYMDTQSFSATGLRDQLEFEGFTPEEVAHGVAAVGY